MDFLFIGNYDFTHNKNDALLGVVFFVFKLRCNKYLIHLRHSYIIQV